MALQQCVRGTITHRFVTLVLYILSSGLPARILPLQERMPKAESLNATIITYHSLHARIKISGEKLGV